jgi:hypothetical protein
VPNPGTFQESAPSSVTGQIVLGTKVATNGIKGKYGSLLQGAQYDTLLSQAVSTALNDSANYQTLTATPSVQSQLSSTVTGKVTVNLVNGEQNVIYLSSFTLNNGSNTLTFNGSAGTSVIINVAGNFNLHTGNIAVSGGMGPLDVLWNVYGKNSTVTTMVPTTGVGVILAPYAKINSMDSSTFTGTLIGGYGSVVTLISCTTVSNPCSGPVTTSGNAFTVSCPVNVNPVYNPTLPSNSYTSPVTVAGGSGSYTFAVTGGALGDGLTLDTSTGVISGNLNSYNALNFSITATDNNTGKTGTTPLGGCYIVPID